MNTSLATKIAISTAWLTAFSSFVNPGFISRDVVIDPQGMESADESKDLRSATNDGDPLVAM